MNCRAHRTSLATLPLQVSDAIMQGPWPDVDMQAGLAPDRNTPPVQNGKKLLPGANISQPDTLYEDDDFTDEEGEEALEQDEANSADQKAKEEAELKQCLQSVETDEMLAQDLLKMQEDPKSVPALCEEEAPDSGDEEPSPEPAAKAAKSRSCLTLWQVLEAADLSNFQPGKDDSARLLFARIRRLAPHMMSLNRQVRLAEGLLSPALINGKPKTERRQCRWEYLLARLREQCLMSAKNQTRMQLWADYTTRCAAAAEKTTQKDQGQSRAAMPLTQLRPCWEPNRCVQVVVCRPLATNVGPFHGLRLGITLGVWRAGRRGGDGKSLKVRVLST